jgi:hypothetical protein
VECKQETWHCKDLTVSYFVVQVLSLSIWTYKGPVTASEAKEQVFAASEQIVPKSQIWLPILALYTPVHLFSFVVVSSFLILPLRFAVTFWVASLLVYYAITLQGNPQHTGPPLLSSAKASSSI